MKLSQKTAHVLLLFLFDLILVNGLNYLERVSLWTVEQYLKYKFIFPSQLFLNCINYIIKCLGQNIQTSEVNASFRERSVLGRACHS